MKPGDIVLIRFPQADLKSGKLRPALIIAISPSRHRDLLLDNSSEQQTRRDQIGYSNELQILSE